MRSVGLFLFLVYYVARTHCCQELDMALSHHRLTSGNRSEQWVMQGGNRHGIVLYWGNATGRAAAELLAVLLVYVYRFRGVTTQQAPWSLADFAAKYEFSHDRNITIVVSALWERGYTPCYALSSDQPRRCHPHALSGTRLRLQQTSVVPAQASVHLRIAIGAPESCHDNATSWNFYTDLDALHKCLFTTEDDSTNGTRKVNIYTINPELEILIVPQLKNRINNSLTPLHLQIKQSNRKQILRELSDTNRSILFLDYDIWANDPTVARLTPPSCTHLGYPCREQLDWADGVTATEKDLHTVSPLLYDILVKYQPSPDILRNILELESERGNITEATCEWSSKNVELFKSWLPISPADFIIKIFSCIQSDPKKLTIFHIQIAKVLGTQTKGLNIGLTNVPFNCTDPMELSLDIEELIDGWQGKRIIGIVAPASAGTAAAVELAKTRRVPLLVSTSSEDASEARAITTTLMKFLFIHSWKRLTVISENTTFAKTLLSNILANKEVSAKSLSLRKNMTLEEERELSGNLSGSPERIIFVNAASDATEALLSVAEKNGLSEKEGYVWIVRERLPTTITSNITHFVVTYWHNPLVTATQNLTFLRHESENNIAYAQAVLLLGRGFGNLLKHELQDVSELHTQDMYRKLIQILRNETIMKGSNISGLLRLEGQPLGLPTIRRDALINGQPVSTLLHSCAGLQVHRHCDLMRYPDEIHSYVLYEWAMIVGLLAIIPITIIIIAKLKKT